MRIGYYFGRYTIEITSDCFSKQRRLTLIKLLFNSKVISYLGFRESDGRIVFLDASAIVVSSRKLAVVERTLHLPLRASYAIVAFPVVPPSDTFLNTTFRLDLTLSAVFHRKKENIDFAVVHSPSRNRRVITSFHRKIILLLCLVNKHDVTFEQNFPIRSTPQMYANTPNIRVSLLFLF